MEMSDDLLKDPLPEPWTFGVTQDGRIFFINDEERITTWLHPDTGQAAVTGFQRTIDLPCGWERAFTSEGQIYFINHNNQSTTLIHPSRDIPKEETENDQSPNEGNAEKKKKKRRPSFTGTLTRPLFRRSSSKSRTKVEKSPSKRFSLKEGRSSSQHRSSLTRGQKMTVHRLDSSTVARSGWLYKQDNQGVGGVKMWRKRWFVLADFCLYYYKDAKEDEVLGSLVLPSYQISTVNPDDKINRKYAFKIEHPGMRTYYMSGDSYSEMAQWVKIITPICSLTPNQAQKSPKKSIGATDLSKPTNEDAEFGFNEVRQPIDRDASPATNNKPVANGNNNNVKAPLQNDPIIRGSSRTSRQTRSSSNSNRTYSNSASTPSDSRRRISSEPPRRLSSRKSQSTAGSNANYNGSQYYSSEISTPERKRALLQNNDNIKRNDSMVKLGSWVMTQKHRQQSNSTLNSQQRRRAPNNFDTASELSSASSPRRNKAGYFYQPPPSSSRSANTRSAPSSGKRYRPGTYNDYMDPMEVASSIMSVPPMFRKQKVLSLPRPRSTQGLDEKQRVPRRTIPNSKSTPHLDPNVPPINPGNHHVPRTKSEHYLPVDGSSSTPTSGSTPRSAHTPRRQTDDVFSPLPINGQYSNFNYNTISPISHSTMSPKSPNPNYEVKQMDVKGRQGQLRAFAISVKPKVNNTPDVIPTQSVNKEFGNLDINDNNIEAKLNRLNELDRTLNNVTTEISKLQDDKNRLEKSLYNAKDTFSTASEFELEEHLSKVKSQLLKSAGKLKEMTRENEIFEREVRKLKLKLLEELNAKSNASNSNSHQRQLEWELGRVEFMMQGLNKNKIGLVNKTESIQGDSRKQGSMTLGRNDYSTHKSELRSPRNVKKVSTARRTSGGSVGNGSKYFTLPGRGVGHASSVDSLTAESLARYSRTFNAKSPSLHRTKSAAERLLHSSYGNLSSDPSEIKKIQKELHQNRRRTLTVGNDTRANTNHRSYDTHMKVGIDVQMAIKHHRMPKVLQRAKRDMQRGDAEKQPISKRHEYGFDIDNFENEASTGEKYEPGDVMVDGVTMPDSPHKEEDLEPEELYVMDVNLTHQLIAPDKVEIPDRLMEYEDVILSPSQERNKQKKIRAIETMLARSGQAASQPVHLAAALAAEAGSVARAVAHQAQHTKQQFSPSIV